MQRTSIIGARRERGAVLVIALVILAMMTLIGTTAMRTNTLEERMAGNMRDHDLAFQAAETALRDAEKNMIDKLVNLNLFDGTGGLYGRDDSMPADLFASSVWSGANSRSYGSQTAEHELPQVNADPRYLVKMIGELETGRKALNLGGYGKKRPSTDVTFFSVTARGTGGSDRSQVILRSRYGRIVI